MKAKLARLLDLMSLAIVALCMAMLLLAGQVIPIAYLAPLQPVLWVVMLLLCTARWILGARSGQAGMPLPEPAPAFSGAIVILATGFAATAWLGYNGFAADGWSGLILPSVVAVLTLAAAQAVARFASRHEGEIGEARFDTRTRP